MENRTVIFILFMIGWCVFVALWVWGVIQDKKMLLKAEEDWLKEEIERTTEDE